jgi:hypothetical protein
MLLGARSSSHALESAMAVAALSATALLGLVLLRGVRYASLVSSLGAILLAAALGGAATWPWYLLWGLALVAAEPRLARLAAWPAVIVLASLAVRSDGRLVLQIGDAPSVVALYLVASGAAVSVAWRRSRLRGRRRWTRLPARRAATGGAPLAGKSGPVLGRDRVDARRAAGSGAIAGTYDCSLSGRRDVAAACDRASR